MSKDILTDQPLCLPLCAQWAGTALAVPEYRDLLRLDGVNEYADGICTNFHKWGLVAFDCSALWVRDRRVLTNALDVTPAFLRTKHGDTGVVVDYRNWSLSVSAIGVGPWRLFKAKLGREPPARTSVPIAQTVVCSSELWCGRVPLAYSKGETVARCEVIIGRSSK